MATDAVIVPVAGRPLVRAGRRDAIGRLRRWHLVAPAMAQRWPELEYVDLRAEGQVVALPAAPAADEDGASSPGERAPATRTQRQGTGGGRATAGGGDA